MGDRSLDDFLDGEDGSSESGSGTDTGDAGVETGTTGETDASDTDDGEPDGDGVRVDPSTVEPAESTYAWGRDGGACAACGGTVERRWRSDDGLVCPDCKEW